MGDLPRLKHFGWGREGEAITPAEESALLARYAARFGVSEFAEVTPPPLDAIRLSAPRLSPPASLAACCSTATYDRAAHAFGKSYADTLRGLLGDYADAPDVVAYPADEAQLIAVLDWATGAGAQVIPFGGGSSVVGGVTPPPAARGTVTINLRQLDRVLEVDAASRAARIEGGAFGPALEAQLRPHGLTLRHFPQSFEFSTLGGWIATRSGGHFASLFTHIDEFVESVRVVTPAGVVQTRRLPGSGAGPSPDRLFLGSEGVLGIITEAWMRVQARPRFRAGGAVRFPDLAHAMAALRVISQSGLWPANCRVLDPEEVRNTGAGDGRFAVMVLGFEGADHPLDPAMARALECCADHGGAAELAAADAHREGAAEAWRTAFIRMPYARERTIGRAIINDTFETAITWDRFEAFHAAVKGATEAAIRDATGRPGQVTCRITHVYPDGPAPYFTFHALGRHGGLMEQWGAIKRAASDALIAEGGTITHHHAVGREHRPWYDRERPKLFAQALRAAKRTLDPAGLLNPGVLIDP